MTEPARTATASDSLQHEELFPIRDVARLTGVNPVTLRAWERRYGLIQPTRTDSGHRLYSAADIDTVRSILAWIERGVSVSRVGKILARSGAIRTPLTLQGAGPDNAWGEWQGRIREAVAAFDGVALARLYDQLLAGSSVLELFQELYMPLWQELLLRRDEPGQVSEWLFLDGFLRARVLQRLQLSCGPTPVLLAALPGQCRELELLVAGLLLGSPGLALQVLGPGQPLAELPLVCERLRPQALVLFSNQPPAADFGQQLRHLALSLQCPLLLAGDAADLAEEELAGSPIACLGNEGGLMQQRLQQFLAGHLDT
ncbi:helix-turn-helix-type transcriptional regulator [Pseudomonas alcaligenes]|uniref:Helix-turn-helix-type transcriptional regulator n=1 Tax=Aquipseudomonas alcaligenes TaxID=43263 RepID=A0ABR7S2H1_AQUAC|nr:MerR family transcriptional regulator [Pseudomonas alcaligenes]MBC9251780.1 helix-turn-helix-type transcriptional regulator [Pseudomonas alcaligenes]